MTPSILLLEISFTRISGSWGAISVSLNPSEFNLAGCRGLPSLQPNSLLRTLQLSDTSWSPGQSHIFWVPVNGHVPSLFQFWFPKFSGLRHQPIYSFSELHRITASLMVLSVGCFLPESLTPTSAFSGGLAGWKIQDDLTHTSGSYCWLLAGLLLFVSSWFLTLQ